MEFSVHDFEGTSGYSDKLGYMRFANESCVAYKVVDEAEAANSIRASQIEIPEEFNDIIFIPQVYAIVELHEAAWLAKKVEGSRLNYNSGSMVLFQSFCAGSALHEIENHDFTNARGMTAECVDRLISFCEHLNSTGIKHGSLHLGNVIYDNTHSLSMIPSSEVLAFFGASKCVMRQQPLNSFAIIDWESAKFSQQGLQDDLQQLYEFRERLEERLASQGFVAQIKN